MPGLGGGLAGFIGPALNAFGIGGKFAPFIGPAISMLNGGGLNGFLGPAVSALSGMLNGNGSPNGANSNASAPNNRPAGNQSWLSGYPQTPFFGRPFPFWTIPEFMEMYGAPIPMEADIWGFF